MKDIQTRSDIELLVNKFYQKVIQDGIIGYVFTELVQLDWEKHIPIMYDFWDTTLLGTMKYKGNPMTKHILLNKVEPLHPEHFRRWIELWEGTIEANFSGAKAREAIQRAKSIAELMMHKIGENEKS